MADPKPFNEIAAGFPSDMPAELYDQARKRYFDDVIAPRLDRGSSPLAAWKQFQQNTERKSTLGTSGKYALPVAQAASGFTHALVKPLANLTKSPTLKRVSDLSERAEKSLTRTAAREGRSNIPTGLGEMAGSVAPIALAAETGGATLEMGGLETASTAYKLLRGGLAFGTFEAMSADEGNRLTAGIKGFGTGLAFEGALGLGGKLLRRGIPQSEVDKIVTKVLSGEADANPVIDKEITESVKSDARGSKAEGRPQFVKEDPNFKGVGVLLHDAEGKPITIKVKSGSEHAAVKQVLDITNAGGAVDGIIHHPDDVGLANRFMRSSADTGAQRYEGVKQLRTEKGQARKVALEDELNGKPTVATNPDTVVTQTPQRATPKDHEIQSGIAQLRDEEGYELSKGAQMQIGRQIRALWDDRVPEQRKGMVADQLATWELGDLIPQEWRREKPLPEGIEPEPSTEDILTRAKELGVSEAELNRLQEIHEREPVRVGGERFEDIGTTTKEMQAVHNILIPESEDFELGADGTKVPYEEGAHVGITPRRFAIMTSKRTLQRGLLGAAALTHPPEMLDNILDRFGLSKTGIGEEARPAVIFEKNPSRTYAYHEGLHVDKYHVPDGERVIQFLDEDAQQSSVHRTASEIGQGLRKFGAYKEMPEEVMREEAFVHAATAIRTGDTNYLAELVRMDGSVDDVFDMVNDRAKQLLRATTTGVDSAPARVLQRKMSDLILRTTNTKSWELMDQTSKFNGDWWYDPEGRAWKLKTTEQLAEETYDSYKGLVDNISKQGGEDWAPSSTLFAEARGVRGPVVPPGGGPIKDPIAMDTPPDTRWQGWTAVSGWFRPMGPWVADLHTRVNDALSVSGKRLPIYDRWKDVDEAFRNGDNWLQDNYDRAAKLLDGVGKKQYDYFQVLTTEERHWPEMARQLNLDANDLNRIKQIDDWFNDFRNDTGILVKNYLRDEFPRLRSFGYNMEMVYGTTQKTPAQMSTFERLITQGKIDPKSTHVGSFMDTMLREGFSKKFSDKPLKELEKLVDLKAKDGSYLLGNMRHPLVNYTRYMRGIPDVTAQVMNKSVGEFFDFLGKKGAEMNKHLPSYAQLPTEYSYPRSYINRMLVWSYAAGLGLRAAIPIRDAMQVMSTTLPVIGPAKFARGLARFAREGFTFADEQGALLKRHNIGDLYGDIFNELPAGASTDKVTKLANKLLAPSRWGHNVGRAIGFYGEYDSALEGVNAYRTGKIDADALIKEHTSLWWNDKPVINRIMGQIADPGFSSEDIARNIALETTDLTLWPYRRGTQPSLLRTGMGRIFGQFGMWPMNYMDFLRRGATKFAEHPSNALKTTATWAACNYAAVAAMNGIGADAGKWFWVSPAAIDMSPHAKFVEDLASMWKDSPDGREARKRVLEYPLDFFPSSIEMQQIGKVLQSGDEPFDSDGHPTPALLQILGFKPLKETPDRDLEDEFKFQTGFGHERRSH